MVRQKKTSVTEDVNKPGSNTQPNGFQVYEPVKFNSTFNNNSASQNFNE